MARGYILALNDDNKFHAFVQFGANGDANLAGATTPQLNTWYHVAMTFDGLKLRLYVNGVLDGILDAIGEVVPISNPVSIGGNIVPACSF